MTKLEDRQENWERVRTARNLPRPRSVVSLAEDLLRSLKESAAFQTDEEASSQLPTPVTTEKV